MMAALKIPKAFLGYEEQIGAKATLAAEDVRFARTIERLQRIIISELTNIAIVHLLSQGITDERLVDFQLELTNPSSVAEQEKIAIWESKVRLANEILTTQTPTLSSDWVYKTIYGFSDAQIEDERKLVVDDKKRTFRLTQIEAEGNDPVKTGQSFGTAHDLAALQMTQGQDETPDYGDTNFNPNKPFQVTPNANADPNIDPYNIGGRPPEGMKFGQDSHPRGRNPLGAKDLHGSLEQDNTLDHKHKKGPLHREQTESKKNRISKQRVEQISRLLPEKFKKNGKTLMESIGIEGETTESIEKTTESGMLDEHNLDIDDANGKADALNV
jgi:hypothetical protein